MKIVNKIMATILLVCALVFIGTLFYIQMIPSKYLIPLVILYGIIVFILTFFLFRKKTKTSVSILLNVFVIPILIGTIVGEFYAFKTYYSLDQMNNKQEEMDIYYIVALKESKASKLEDVENQELGIYTKQDETLEKALSSLQKNISFQQKKYTDIQKMASSLLNHQESFLLLKGSYKTILEDTNQNFKEKIKVIYQLSIQTKMDKIEKTVQNPLEQPFNIFISGIDTYGDIMTKSQGDVNIVVTVNPKTHEILLTVIPRDYYVYLHGITECKDKLTHAAYYGIGMSVRTVEDLLDTQISYYVRVNFDTLIRTVDIIGGIDVYSDKTFTAYTNRTVTIKKGMNHMNGKEALAFARERMTYATGDRHRGENQQAVLMAIIQKLTNKATLLTKYDRILDQLQSSFETNMETKWMTGYINKQLESMPSWNIKTYNLNGYDSHNMTYSLGIERYVMEPDWKTVTEGKRRIQGMLKGETFSKMGL